jgi:hypothetical protein
MLSLSSFYYLRGDEFYDKGGINTGRIFKTATEFGIDLNKLPFIYHL